VGDVAAAVDRSAVSAELQHWLERLFPLTRSLTGEGNRATLRALQELVPLTIREVPSGTRVYDWTIPDEWSIRDAYIAGRDGRRIVDFHASNLHVVSYSEPVRGRFDWSALEPHVFTHPSLSDAIPYRTSYYRRTWGFCATRAQYDALAADGGPFDVCIDSTLAPGSLSYGELLIPGRSSREVLVSSYICHPSMANDSLSGVLLSAFLAREIAARPARECTYRFVFVPETIGAIAYCALNEAAMKRIDMALVVTTVGGRGPCGYKQSFDPAHPLNAMIEDVFAEAGITSFARYPFDIHGSDERQYSSQGFRINTATISRDRYYEYPEYHSSLDNLSFVTGEQIAGTLDLYRRLIDRIESRRVFRSRVPHCEVMLGKHDLYPAAGGALRPIAGGRTELDLILWTLFLSDGTLAVSEIARRLAVPEAAIAETVARLEAKGVLERV